MSSSSSNVNDEIDAAFAAGAMPPEWRPRLLASQRLDEADVDTIAADIAEIHSILQFVGSTKQSIAPVVFWFLFGVLFLCVAGLFFRANDYKRGALSVGAAVPGVVFNPIVAVLYECQRRRVKMLMAQTRTVLENCLLPPV
uniref:Transmembrane protein n=1 Tax=Oryza punctata TaxID=4537 RepID=A0A0E0M3V1_ORYPU